MKKLRMIVSSLVVLAIVGSAFAFKAKVAVFCVDDTNVGTQSCYTITQKRITSVSQIGNETLFYKQLWDGSPSTCTSDCPTQALFRAD